MNIVIWNANGLSQHLLEIKSFLYTNNVDLLLVSETHFTSKTYFEISNYKTYHTIHPDGTAHGGSAILVKSSIRHTELPKYQTNEIQATSIEVHDGSGSLCISALYSPPKYKIKKNI